jgi:hypothetical protein
MGLHRAYGTGSVFSVSNRAASLPYISDIVPQKSIPVPAQPAPYNGNDPKLLIAEGLRQLEGVKTDLAKPASYDGNNSQLLIAEGLRQMEQK